MMRGLPSVLCRDLKNDYTEGVASRKLFSGNRFYRILIADDAPFLRKKMCRILEMAGHSVVAVSNAFEAIERSKEQTFDLAFIDLFMPGRGTRAIHELMKLSPSTLFIAMTGSADNKEILKARKAGSFLCLRKPFRASKLIRYVSSLPEAKAWDEVCHEWSKIPPSIYPRSSRRTVQSRLLVIFFSILLSVFVFQFCLVPFMKFLNTDVQQKRNVSFEEMYRTIEGYLQRDEARELRR